MIKVRMIISVDAEYAYDKIKHHEKWKMDKSNILQNNNGHFPFKNHFYLFLFCF